MAPHRCDDQQDRRTFLKTLGLAGGALAGATAASAAPVLTRPRSTTTVAPPPSGQTRSTARLRLKQPLKLQTQTPGASPLSGPPLPATRPVGRIPLPSSRQRLLQTVFDPPTGGNGLDPNDFGLRRMADMSFSLPRDIVASYDRPLAEAYAQGVTLTPAGCEYAPGAEYAGTPPMKYMAYRTTYTSPDVFGKQVPLITSATDYTWFLQIQWRTPFSAATHRSYILELSMAGFCSDFWITLYSAGTGNVPGQYLDQIEFSPTSDNTQMALVQMPGSGESDYTHTLWFRPGNYANKQAYFNWLNILAV